MPLQVLLCSHTEYSFRFRFPFLHKVNSKLAEMACANANGRAILLGSQVPNSSSVDLFRHDRRLPSGAKFNFNLFLLSGYYDLQYVEATKLRSLILGMFLLRAMT